MTPKQQQDLGNNIQMLSPLLSFIPGGQIVAPIAGIAGNLLQQNALDNMNNVPISRLNYNTGGMMRDKDTPLSPNAFQVKGKASQTDSERFGNIKLDHNEVVKNDSFVFSDKLFNPLTGLKFSVEAASYEKTIAKAAKSHEKTRSPEALNTIELATKMSANTAALQEAIATKLGLRPEATTPQGYAYGGPTSEPNLNMAPMNYLLSPLQQLEFVGMPNTDLQLATNNYTNYVKPSPLPTTNTTPVKKMATGGPITPEDIQAAYMQMFPENTYYDPKKKKFAYDKFIKSEDFQPFLKQINYQYDPATSRYIDKTQAAQDFAQGFIRDQNRIVNIPQPFAPANSAQPNVVADQRQAGLNAQLAGVNIPQVQMNLPTEEEFKARNYERAKLQELYQDTEQAPDMDPTNPPTAQTKKGLGIGVGDSLQYLELASKFFGLGSSQKDQINPITAPITQKTFDPTNQLNNSQQEYQKMVNSLSQYSPNIANAMSQQAYASKLNADNNVLASAQQTNNQYRGMFEQQLAQRQAQNTQFQVQEDDLNSRNRAAYDSAVQNAFTSVGNLGRAKNVQDNAQAQLQMLQTLYPSIYNSIMAKLTKTPQANG